MTTPDTARREAYARIISPNAWAFADKWASRPEMAAEIVYETGPSLRTSDAILAKESEALAEALARVAKLELAARNALYDLCGVRGNSRDDDERADLAETINQLNEALLPAGDKRP